MKEKYIRLFALTICIENFINVGYFISIGKFELLYSEILIFVLGLFSIIIIFKNSFDKKTFIFGILLIFSVLISNILLILFPLEHKIITYGMSWRNYFYGIMDYPEFTIQTIKMSLRIILYVIISIGSISVIDKDKDKIKTIQRYFIKFGVGIVSFTILEFIIKNIFKSNIINIFMSWFFGLGESTLEVLLERNNTYALQGFMKEPAHFAYGMFFLGLILIFSYDKDKSLRDIIAVSIVILLSRSFSAVIYIIVLFCIYAVFNKKKTIYLLCLILLVPLVVSSTYFNYYIERLDNIIQLFIDPQFNQIISEHIRIISVIENIKIFLRRPLFGIGIGTSYGHGFVPTLLSNIGILGFIFWTALIFSGVSKMNRSLNNYIVVFLLLACWMFTGSISNAYSMPLLLIALSIRYNQSNYIN